MVTMRTNYRFTKHLKERYQERILSIKKTEINIRDTALNTQILQDILTAKENRTWTNNQDLILHLYEEYGNCNFNILESTKTIFVCAKDDIAKNYLHVITCWHKVKDWFFKNIKLKVMTKDEKIIKIKELKKANKNKPSKKF